MKKVFCIGELLIDFIAEKQGSDLSKATEFTKKAGGAPANVACAISKLGGQSAFVGCVGKDPFGSFLLNTLKEGSIDISFAQRSKTFTTLAFVSIAMDGERDFVFSRGADRELTYQPELSAQFNGNIVHFGAATALLGGPLEETYALYLKDAAKNNAFISYDPNYRRDLWKGSEAIFTKKCRPYIAKAHLCKFSLEEAQLLSGKETLEEACEILHALGTKIITVTLGEDGTYVSTPTLKKIIPTIKVSPVDTTGAGDAFIGCLLKILATKESPMSLWENGAQLEAMVSEANKAGAITTTNFGAIAALPNQAQLDNYGLR